MFRSSHLFVLYRNKRAKYGDEVEEMSASDTHIVSAPLDAETNQTPSLTPLQNTSVPQSRPSLSSIAKAIERKENENSKTTSAPSHTPTETAAPLCEPSSLSTSVSQYLDRSQSNSPFIHTPIPISLLSQSLPQNLRWKEIRSGRFMYINHQILIENYLHSTQIQQQASLLLLEFGKECLQKEVKATFIWIVRVFSLDCLQLFLGFFFLSHRGKQLPL